MEQKTQHRAICPACFKQHAVRGNLMVEHGYQRPYGWHSNVNRCYGTLRPHFGTEAGRDAAAKCAAALREYATKQRESADKVLAGELPARDYKGRVIEEPKQHHRENTAQRIRIEAGQADNDARYIEERVGNWEPAEPVQVAVEKKVTLIHWRRPEWGKACAASRIGAEKGYTAKDENMVTCSKCLAILEARKVTLEKVNEHRENRSQ